MNLRNLLLLCSLFFFVYSCSDSGNETPPKDIPNLEAEKQIEEVIDLIGNDKELSTFKEALAKVDAKKFEEKEFTILAYKTKQDAKAPTTKATDAKNTVQQDNETLRHIIGGHHPLDALKKLRYIVALSKDTLFIKYSEAEKTIAINGVLLGKSMTAGKSIVFVTDSIIPQAKDTAVIKEKEYLFRVMNINANWSPENASEASGFAENALITIYKEDKVIKELKTDKDGLARFTYKEDNDLEFLVKTDTSSMLYQRYFVQGLFFSQELVETSPIQKEYKAVMGGLRFMDINADGVIDSNDTMDKYPLKNLSEDQILHLVGKSYTFPKDEPEKENITIDMAYDAYDDAEELFARLDNNYSTRESRQSLSPSNKMVDTLWHDTYEAIRKINIVMENSATEKEDRIELEGFRANLFLSLRNAFGDVPLQLTDQLENMPSTSSKNIDDFILNSYSSVLDHTADSVKYKSDEYINSILVYRLQKNHNHTRNLAQQAINSGRISLNSNFKQSEINAVRLYLFLAEASCELGNLAEGIQAMNVLLKAEGKPLLATNTTTEQLRTDIHAFYKKTNNYEISYDSGIKYCNTLSWSISDAWGKYKLLPIPNSVLTAFGTETLMQQNLGW